MPDMLRDMFPTPPPEGTTTRHVLTTTRARYVTIGRDREVTSTIKRTECSSRNRHRYRYSMDTFYSWHHISECHLGVASRHYGLQLLVCGNLLLATKLLLTGIKVLRLDTKLLGKRLLAKLLLLLLSLLIPQLLGLPGVLAG